MSSDASDNSWDGVTNPYPQDDLQSYSVTTNSVAKLSTTPITRLFSTSAYSSGVYNNPYNLNVNATSTSYTTTNKSVSFKMKRF